MAGKLLHRIFIGVEKPVVIPPPPSGDLWLQEDEAYVLQEDNSYVELENN